MQSSRIAVIGANGQLGKELVSLIPDEAVWPLTREQADLIKPGQILQLFKQSTPRIVLNCAAYNLVDQSETTPEVAFAVNAFGIRELALACREVGATLVQFSTDYVFGLDTSRQQPYTESAAPDPISAYGMSKLAGEYFVRALCPQHFIVRTCGLYGKYGVGGKGTNFVETMLKLAGMGKTIKVVGDQVLTPTSASDLAQASLQLIETKRYGLYHMTNAGQCSWYEFAKTVFELTDTNANLQSTTTAEYGSKAARPSYSVLESEHAHTPRLRHWREALSEYLAMRG